MCFDSNPCHWMFLVARGPKPPAHGCYQYDLTHGDGDDPTKRKNCVGARERYGFFSVAVVGVVVVRTVGICTGHRHPERHMASHRHGKRHGLPECLHFDGWF